MQVAPPKVLFFLFLANTYSSFFCFFTFPPLCFYIKLGIFTAKIAEFSASGDIRRVFFMILICSRHFYGFRGAEFNTTGKRKPGKAPLPATEKHRHTSRPECARTSHRPALPHTRKPSKQRASHALPPPAGAAATPPVTSLIRRHQIFHRNVPQAWRRLFDFAFYKIYKILHYKLTKM